MGRSNRARKERGPRFDGTEVIGELLERDRRVQDVLLRFGLPCHRCVVKDFETLAEGCAPLGLELGEVLASLNALPE